MQACGSRTDSFDQKRRNGKNQDVKIQAERETCEYVKV